MVQITAAAPYSRNDVTITHRLGSKLFKLVLLKLTPRVVFEVMTVVFSALGPNSDEI